MERYLVSMDIFLKKVDIKSYKDQSELSAQ